MQTRCSAAIFFRPGAGLWLAGERVWRSRHDCASPADGGGPGAGFHLWAERAPGFPSGLEGETASRNADRISGEAGPAADAARPAALPRRSGGQPAPRRRLCSHRPAMGEDGPACARPGQARRQAGIARPVLARFAGQPRLFVRLVEQSRRSWRSRVRLRRHAGAEMVTPGLA